MEQRHQCALTDQMVADIVGAVQVGWQRPDAGEKSLRAAIEDGCVFTHKLSSPMGPMERWAVRIGPKWISVVLADSVIVTVLVSGAELRKKRKPPRSGGFLHQPKLDIADTFCCEH